MKAYPCISAIVLAAAATSLCGAAQKTPPDQIAATLAPLLDEQALVVGHLDCEGLDVGASMKAIAGLLDKQAAIAEQITSPHISSILALQKTGARDLYFLLSVADLPIATGAFFVPVPENVQAESIANIFRPFKEFQVDQVGSNVVFGDHKTVPRLKNVSPVPRAHLVDALAAVSDAPLKIVLTLPAYFRPVIEQTLPELPEVVGGGPSTVLTAGIQWVAIGIAVEQQPGIRVVVQSESPEAAAALAERFSEACGLLRKNEKARTDLPAIDQVIPLLEPAVENDRVVLTLSVENGRLPKLLESLLPK